jgi:hypothetical protein
MQYTNDNKSFYLAPVPLRLRVGKLKATLLLSRVLGRIFMTHDKLGGNVGATVFAALRESNNYREDNGQPNRDPSVEALEPAQKNVNRKPQTNS